MSTTQPDETEEVESIAIVDVDELEGAWKLWQYAKSCEEQWHEIRGHAAELIKEKMGDARVGMIGGKPVIQHTYYTWRRFNVTKFKKESPKLYDAYAVETQSEKFGPVTKTLAAAVEEGE